MAMNVFRSQDRRDGSGLDALAIGVLGFVLGLCVNGATPSLAWLLAIVHGQ
jgi:hypothetical protein